jgi:hypothetical protein
MLGDFIGTTLGKVAAIIAGVLFATVCAMSWYAHGLQQEVRALNQQIGSLTGERDSAVAAGAACSASVTALAQAAQDNEVAAMASVADAKKRAAEAERKAQARDNRPPALPGNSCGTAEAETREWLKERLK